MKKILFCFEKRFTSDLLCVKIINLLLEKCTLLLILWCLVKCILKMKIKWTQIRNLKISVTPSLPRGKKKKKRKAIAMHESAGLWRSSGQSWACYFRTYVFFLKPSGIWGLRLYKTAHRSDCSWRGSCLHLVMKFKLEAVQAES